LVTEVDLILKRWSIHNFFVFEYAGFYFDFEMQICGFSGVWIVDMKNEFDLLICRFMKRMHK
jgi:hypothetical protein